MAATAERVLTRRELNRALLARQLLLERARVPVPNAIEQVGPLQAQWPPSPYIALWTRLEGFEREALAQALERREVVKATLMRRTLHLVSAEDYVAFVQVLREPWVSASSRQLAADGEPVDVGAVAERLAGSIGREPRTRAELFELLRPLAPPALEPGRSWFFWSAVQAHARIVHAPASAMWRTSGSPSFLAGESWLGAPPVSLDDARARLIPRYLGAFGPATWGDLLSWSGLPGRDLRGGLEALEPELRRFRDEASRSLLDLAGAPLPDPDTPATARFLPKWDSALLAYAAAERTRIIPEQFRKTTIRVNGDVLPTFLVDGFVAGVWTIARKSGEAVLEVAPLGRLTKRDRGVLAEEGERLARFVQPQAKSYAVRFSGSA